MKNHMSSFVLLYALGVLACLNFGYGSITGGYWNRSCIESEKQALLLFKLSLFDYTNHLLSWVGNDCCAWHGIICNNRTGRVMRINLSHNTFRFSGTRIPGFFENLTSLSELDLSHNELQGLIPQSIGKLTSLTHLDLSSNNFQGLIPQSIGKLTSLTHLDLSSNHFQGLIPQSIGKLTSLTQLDLSSNNFQGLIPQSIGKLTSLTHLDLSSNRLDGLLPKTIRNLTLLSTLDLSRNGLNGCLSKAVCQLSNLEELDVANNNLNGSIPKCIGELSNLKNLDLFSNSWEGFVSEHHFVHLNKLTYLSISSESKLAFNVSSEWVPPFQLQNLYIESVKVGPQFPQWLLTQRHIMYIRMPNTGISDIPADKFVSILSQAVVVDLSNNDINTRELSSILTVPNGLGELNLSNNRLSGKFPTFLCKLTSLFALFLSNNYFSGELPRCLGNLTKLRDLDVMNNNLAGDIPVSLGYLGSLTYLNLHNNMFQGRLPLSFQNLTQIVTLDVGKNNLSDRIPPWAGEQLPGLRYLILRSNNFFGKIPANLCHHLSLQVLHLAHNKITGNIPSCFGNFSAMITGDNSDSSFRAFDGEMIIDDIKGYELEYTSTLSFVVSIDLSNNNISGEIPEELMDLRGLVSLNLAGNHLRGRIPDRIGKLKNLEFLDLSRNELYGPIPQSMSDLLSLSGLNLSFNDLSGIIPAGKQLETLDDPSIYTGNNQLCGRLIGKQCAGVTESHNVPDYKKSNLNSDTERMWFYAGIGPGLSVGFLGFCAPLYFITSWRYTYFHFLEQVCDKIVVVNALLWRKFNK